MKKLTLLLTLSLTITTFKLVHSQNNRLSIDLNYPVPTGENAFSYYYMGITDVGAKYNFLNLSKFDVGVSGNIGLLKNASKSAPVNIYVLMLKPRISTELKIWRLNPYLGIGYSYLYIFFDANVSNIEDMDKSMDGINLNVGLKIQLISRLYFNLGYDYIRFREQEESNSNSNHNTHLIEAGFGLQF